MQDDNLPRQYFAWNFGQRAADALDHHGLLLRWFDWVLRGEGNGADDDPLARIFVMGENRWRDEAEWPLARAVPTPY